MINQFVLAGGKFMHKMHLGQSGFNYSATGPFTKNKDRIQKFKETGDSRYIYQNELEKVCFQHEMTYGDFKALPTRTISDKLLHNKVFNILILLKIQNMIDVSVELLQCFTIFLIKSILWCYCTCTVRDLSYVTKNQNIFLFIMNMY